MENRKRVLLPDLRILTGARQGDSRTISRLFRDYFLPIRWMVLAHQGSEQDARDLHTELIVWWCQQLQEGQTLPEGCSLQDFLYTQALQAWNAHLLAEGLPPVPTGYPHPCRLCPAYHLPELPAAPAHVLQAYLALPPELRMGLRMWLAQGLSGVAIAQRLGLEKDDEAAMRMLQRTLGNLQQQFPDLDLQLQDPTRSPLLRALLRQEQEAPLRALLQGLELPRNPMPDSSAPSPAPSPIRIETIEGGGSFWQWIKRMLS